MERFQIYIYSFTVRLIKVVRDDDLYLVFVLVVWVIFLLVRSILHLYISLGCIPNKI